ncbi:putative membrane protein [Synechococcus sp. MIT S9220]|nr:putative membrane protein [Synechococcus sp. MIT S9220]
MIGAITISPCVLAKALMVLSILFLIAYSVAHWTDEHQVGGFV